MIDGEGCVSYKRYGPGRLSRSVKISNTEMDIIDAIVAAASRLEIPSHISCMSERKNPRHRRPWEVGFTKREALEKLLELPIRSGRKRAKLEEAVASYLPRRRVFTAEDIRRLYVEEQMTIVEVAAALDTTNGTIIKRMRAAGIPSRSRGYRSLKAPTLLLVLDEIDVEAAA